MSSQEACLAKPPLTTGFKQTARTFEDQLSSLKFHKCSLLVSRFLDQIGVPVSHQPSQGNTSVEGRATAVQLAEALEDAEMHHHDLSSSDHW